jgi:molybdenum cofactor guanylyltransferase
LTVPVPPHGDLGPPGLESETGECRDLGAPGLEFETRENIEPGAVGFVLAGGQSRRMGTDKALVEFKGRPLIAHALDLVRAAGLPVFISGARSPLQSFASVVPDSRRDTGPLEGICAALESLKNNNSCLVSGHDNSCLVSGHDFSRAANGENVDRALAPEPSYALFMPVDLPLLPPSLLRYLVHHARITGLAVTLPSVNGFSQTFPVVLSRDALPVLERELASGRRGCFSAFQLVAAARGEPVSLLPVEVLAQSRKITHPAALPVARWFFNVNSPADLHRASTMRAGRVS